MTANFKANVVPGKQIDRCVVEGAKLNAESLSEIGQKIWKRGESEEKHLFFRALTP